MRGARSAPVEVLVGLQCSRPSFDGSVIGDHRVLVGIPMMAWWSPVVLGLCAVLLTSGPGVPAPKKQLPDKTNYRGFIYRGPGDRPRLVIKDPMHHFLNGGVSSPEWAVCSHPSKAKKLEAAGDWKTSA